MAQTVFRSFFGPAELKHGWKIYHNHGMFDVDCVEFTTILRSPDCEGYSTAKQHCSSICNSDIN